MRAATRRQGPALLAEATWPWCLTLLACIVLTGMAYAAIEHACRHEQVIEQTGAPIWELRDQFEAALAHGTALESLPDGDALIQANLVRHPMLTSVDIFTPVGRTVFSTDASTIGTLVPASWQAVFEHWRNHATPRWLVHADGYTTYGVPLLNRHATLAGYISITYRTPPASPVEIPMTSLSSGFLSLSAAALACFVFVLLYRPMSRFVLHQTQRIAQAQHALDDASASRLFTETRTETRSKTHTDTRMPPRADTVTAAALLDTAGTPLDTALQRLLQAEARIEAAERFLANQGARNE
ncbi:hypothetical protein QS306_09280 [Paraburkholderia bonniea]|uniref:hypothetical protein n=1 Tax=Paraburkholderia bonniea TaxID=2152891 RepID=UPI0025746A17|nr:hypothetical protein [Paraburkholderia bonniea]WJF89314.1 hypothetical protein QS306_09280 [Paraburkholderia bonniea]WJF92630.1 hypothetical protein QS308_09290 [Paraburkholderia bonniea]